MANIIDSYSESNGGFNATLSDATDVGEAQSFTGNGSALGSVVWYLKKVGSPVGNATVNIYAHTGTFGTSSKPTGSPLATADATLDVSTLTTFYQLITFTFSGASQITLTNATKYCVAIEYYDAGNSFPSKLVNVQGDSTSPSHAGNRAILSSGTWTAFVTYDMCFYVYDNTGSAVPSTTQNSGFFIL